VVNPTASFVVLIIGNSKSNHLGAQGTSNSDPNPQVQSLALLARLHRERGKPETE